MVMGLGLISVVLGISREGLKHRVRTMLWTILNMMNLKRRIETRVMVGQGLGDAYYGMNLKRRIETAAAGGGGDGEVAESQEKD